MHVEAPHETQLEFPSFSVTFVWSTSPIDGFDMSIKLMILGEN
jgi:hypothetical protein